MNNKSINKLIITFLSISCILGAVSGYFLHQFAKCKLIESNEPTYLFVRPNDSFDSIIKEIELNRPNYSLTLFRQLAKWKKYDENILTGKYRIDNISAYSLLEQLRNGRQTPIRITFNNARTTKDMIKKLQPQLMIDSTEMIKAVEDSTFYTSKGFNHETYPLMFIPNTYEVYWNIGGENFVKRMSSEYDRFWNKEKRAIADSIGLTPIEIGILASIVEEESKDKEDQTMVAGLYLNRLHKGIPLQADPTVKFALQEFGIQRVLRKHLTIDSPYNTYVIKGLPPGPLRIPSIQALQAVLYHKRHDYIYMCAKEDLSGKHNFARTLIEHNRNAARYQAELNRRKIFK